MTDDDLGFVHRFRAPRGAENPVLLLLHGTGGNEEDLLPLGESLWPGAGFLSPRGKVLENGMPRFFRRLAEGVFDLEDLHARAAELGEFVRGASAHYGFDDNRVVAVGLSNGANIASALLLLQPGLLAGAILFRGMVPLVPDPLPRLPATPVLISNGEQDPLVSKVETTRLVQLLEQAGAKVTLRWQPGGHRLTADDVTVARDWLTRR